MKIVRLAEEKGPAYGILDGGMVFRLIGSPFHGQFQRGPEIGPLGSRAILAPCEPTKIICAAKNYPWGENPSKSSRPVLFFKPPSSVIGPGEDIVHPAESQRLIFESELVVVIGRTARNVTAADAPRYILGYTCGNDVTAYDFVLRDNATFHGKSFDTFCPLGPCIETDMNPEKATITCRVNGEVRVSGSTGQKYYTCAELVAFVSGIMTLFAGDIIMTGTPDIGDIRRGDLVEIEIPVIGSLANRVI
ncbi:MAG TPA: fumarylacetoacetate hydrolase family protein [Thermodesulfobacteriota bacterium]|nr:fumarylacetoacetate hydrolase family protein [Thermodesulfobacteriota bacterium]